jgi:SAM-dependent methyltransferase
MQALLKNQLLDLASAPYRHTGQFNYHWARGKLRHDPIFTALLEQPLLPDGARVLDLGCGRGLLAAWLLAAEQLARQGQWCAPVPAPQGLSFRGVELMAREADCGNRALQPVHGQRVQLSAGDMRSTELGGADAIVILDVMHYIEPHEQERLLDQVRAALDRGGLFITRVGDARSGWRFRLSQLVDCCMAFAQGHGATRMWCRPVTEWIGALEARGFAVESRSMSQGTPFANVMLVARLR